MAGGAGDDIYLVHDSGDVVSEQQGEGIDTVNFQTYTLMANVEHLTLMGTTAINGAGNVQDNILREMALPISLTVGPGMTHCLEERAMTRWWAGPALICLTVA